MMKSFLTLLSLLWTLTSCQSGTDKSESLVSDEAMESLSLQDYEMKPDTILIQGTFAASCSAPDMVKIREYNVMYSKTNQVPVTGGNFTYELFLTEPRQVTIRTGKTTFDFLATTKEKVYNVDVTCSGSKETVSVKNSAENEAFLAFVKANQDLRSKLETFEGKDLSDKNLFAELKKDRLEYQKTLVTIAKDHPNTFTAAIICPSEILPEKVFSSSAELSAHYLSREIFSNPEYYNTFLSSRIFVNYMDVIHDKKSGFAPFEEALSIAGKNQEAAKRLQQVLHDLLYYGHREELIQGYMAWMNKNPGSVMNPSVKSHFQSLSRCMPGSQFTEVALKDPKGTIRKLSEVVPSSKVTVLIFYSPTCSHCQQELPRLVPLWEQYKNKGLKIFAVAFDANDNEWDWFIKNKASEEWTHVFESPDGYVPSSSYAVNYTPTFVVIGKDGKIISRFADVDYLKEKLPELLK